VCIECDLKFVLQVSARIWSCQAAQILMGRNGEGIYKHSVGEN
jgi:hypothetical protein